MFSTFKKQTTLLEETIYLFGDFFLLKAKVVLYQPLYVLVLKVACSNSIYFSEELVVILLEP